MRPAIIFLNAIGDSPGERKVKAGAFIPAGQS